MDSLDLYCAYKPLKKYVEKGPKDYSKPFVFGNHCYVVCEQVVRHVQEALSLNIGMLTPSGEVVQISPTHHGTLFTVLLNHVLDQRAPQTSCSTTPLATTPDTRTNEPMSNPLPNNFQSFVNSNQPPMQPTPPAWSTGNINAAEMQFPHCSKSTSCSELGSPHGERPLNLSVNRNSEWNAPNMQTFNASPAFSANQCPFCRKLSARQQVKLRKLIFDDFPNEYDA